MNSNIIAIAKTECKLLLRMKTVRIVWVIFSLITLFYVVVSHTTGFFKPYIPGGFALKVYFFFTLVRMAAASFIAPVFVREDRLHDTFQALSPRPFTNTTYILGKLLGFTSVMLGMDYVFMAILFISSILNPLVPVSVIPYLFYPFIITLPLSIFLWGLNVLAARIYYPLVYLVPILVLTVFLPLEDLECSVWRDVGAITVPLAYSAMTGFLHLKDIINQRLIFMFGGLEMVLIGLLFSETTRRSGILKWHVMLVIALFLVWAGYAWEPVRHTLGMRRSREVRLSAYDRIPSVIVSAYDISVVHNDHSLDIRSRMTISNPTDSVLTKINLKQNINLHTYSVKSGDNTLKYVNINGMYETRIILDTPLEPRHSIELEMASWGTIGNHYNYAYIPYEYYNRTHRRGLTTLGKMTGFVEPDFVLLPAEVEWYPTPFSPHHATDPGYFQKEPIRFTLEVTTHDDLTVISQGKVTKTADNTWRFEPETPLTQMSLTIGTYQKSSVEVDGIEYAYYSTKTNLFKDSGIPRNVLEAAIQTTRKDIETKLGLNYPFKRYQIVETPIHFFGYNTAFDLSTANVQPEIRFIPESSLNLRQFSSRFGPPDILNHIFTSLYTTRTNSRAIRNKMGFSSSLFSMGGLLKFATDPHEDYSSIVSQYTAFTRNHVTDDDYFNLIAFNRLRSKLGIREDNNLDLLRIFYNPSDTAERQYLSGKSLRDILGDEHYAFESMEILGIASRSFFRLLAAKSGVEEYKLDNLITQAWSDTTIDLAVSLSERCGTDVLAMFDEFSRQTQKAHYELTDLTITEHVIDHRTLYNVRFNIANPTPGQGLLQFNAVAKQNECREVVYLEPFTQKEVGLVLTDQPEFLFYYWLPFASYDAEDLVLPDTVREGTESEYFEGIRCVRDGTVPLAIVMDNLDDGCRVISSTKQKPLLRIFNSQDKSKAFIHFKHLKGAKDAPGKWTLCNSLGDGIGDFYGYYSSCYFTKAGNGESVVEYKIPINSPGNYEVYLSVPKGQALKMFLSPLLASGDLGETTVQVMATDGAKEATVDISQNEDAWAYVGTYSFSDATADIKITDKTNASMVVADAVKVRKAK